MESDSRHPLPAKPGWYPRGGDEFSRILAFSDGVFAIAMTLLVVTISLPEVHPESDEVAMTRSVSDMLPSFVSYVISFAVIGRYWVAHHRFCSLLRAIDRRLITINLVYLAVVAFLPFPTDLLGTYFHNPVAVGIYALTVAAISGLEVVLFRHAHRQDLLRERLSGPVYRWGIWNALSPVVLFTVSVPFAFISTYLAVAVWLLSVPLQIAVAPWRPRGTENLPE